MATKLQPLLAIHPCDCLSGSAVITALRVCIPIPSLPQTVRNDLGSLATGCAARYIPGDPRTLAAAARSACPPEFDEDSPP